MKSKLFKDNQGLESAFEACMPDKLSVCLRIDKHTYEHMVAEAGKQGLSSGEYLEKILNRYIAAEHRLH